MKSILEEKFDVPFSVNHIGNIYILSPINECDELFEIRISHPSSVRIVIEIYPQSHGANMLRDMAHADEEKRRMFLDYIDVFRKNNANVHIKINGNDTDLQTWPNEWKNLYIRISKIEDEDIDLDASAREWGVATAAMMLTLLNIVPLGFEEGKKSKIKVNKYERNKLNRELCLLIHGAKCKICGMDFESIYGEIGKGFMHVHHIEPISLMSKPYVLNPEKDLIPVCPNCHAMLHKRNPPYTQEELLLMIQEKLNEKARYKK